MKDKIVENSEDLVNDFQDETISKELQKSEEDIKAGRTIDFEDFKQKLKTKYKI
ncbi:hypothetical protein [Flavobacterium johnsoniae]|jgi:hypothetical protein|uniref:hypothetical protein n=1 Tax=Flavobacterium johnsoniae TaxID=986 RepID=UPI00165919F4|nr:hypothetical protein [Flavobacterium johnsoniae]